MRRVSAVGPGAKQAVPAKGSAISGQATPTEHTHVDNASSSEALASSAPPDSANAGTEPAFWLRWVEQKVTTDRLAGWLVLALGALVFLPRLGSMGLWDPWETHYGEVAREMIVRDDYVYPHWESAYFFSKPPLAMWLMALGMLVFGTETTPIGQDFGGWVEWGVRLPFALIGIAALWGVYRIGTQLRDRYTGLLAAVVLAGSAQFIFIGKQSMVDMPLVGCLTVGLALFCAACFDPDIQARPKARAPSRTRLFAAGGILLGTWPQLFLIIRELENMNGQVAVSAGFVLAFGAAAYVYLKGTRRFCYLVGFYVLAGFAALAKGPAALYVLGPLVLLYIAFTADLHLLWRCWLIPGGLIFLLVAVPWFLTLSLFEGRDDEGKTFVARFWIHDTFNRLGRGVHGDRPTIGYYLEQLAYGMWPWSALAPFAIGFAARQEKKELGDHRRKLLTFVMMWAVWGYVGFSVSKTGFHHYVFPAVPALAILIAYWIRWVADAPEKRLPAFVAVPILAIFVVAMRDMVNDPQHISSLFTYKYDRAYPRLLRASSMRTLGVFLGVGTLLVIGPAIIHRASKYFSAGSKIRPWLERQGRATAMLGFGAIGIIFAAWISHHHFNYLSQHWSQAHMFKTYFDEKKGDEPIYAYQLNWRGETFYSRNTVIQVKESGANQRMRELTDRPGREFIVVEQSRFPTLKNVLSADKRERIRILDKSSIKFYLLVVE